MLTNTKSSAMAFVVYRNMRLWIV